ncbi:MAG: Crp/Fnr family transcriptional regulator [Burkholderiaceae bacterium]
MPEIPLAERVALLTGSEGWFGRAPREFQKAILARCEWSTCSAGQPVYQTADERADLVAVVDGTVEIYSRFGIGDNPLLHLAHEGLWAGYGSVIAGEAPRATVIARVDTLLARVPRRTVHELLAARPEWWRVLSTAAMEYGDIAIAAFADLLIPDNTRRCACTVLRITGLRPPRRARTDRRDVMVTQGELAAMVNLSRTTLVQILRQFERDGLIEQGYRELRVVDPSALAALALGHAPETSKSSDPNNGRGKPNLHSPAAVAPEMPSKIEGPHQGAS